MSTRSYVAFRDEHCTTGVYIHCNGCPAERLKVLREIFHGAFFRDLNQMRTTLLQHTGGWSLLSTDPDLTGRIGAWPGYLEVPGVGYTKSHISRLMRALDLEPGNGLGIADGGDLFDFHHAATETGLLPGATWFCTDGDGQDSDGGWISLPYDLAGVEITTRFFNAGDHRDRDDDGKVPDTRRTVRELLESMQDAIATAARSMQAWRASTPGFVLNIRHPDYADIYIDGFDPEVHTVDLGADFDCKTRDPEQAVEFAAVQLTELYHWPHRLRRIAAARIERAVKISEQAVMLARALAQDTVSVKAVALAGMVLGVAPPGEGVVRALPRPERRGQPAPLAAGAETPDHRLDLLAQPLRIRARPPDRQQRLDQRPLRPLCEGQKPPIDHDNRRDLAGSPGRRRGWRTTLCAIASCSLPLCRLRSANGWGA